MPRDVIPRGILLERGRARDGGIGLAELVASLSRLRPIWGAGSRLVLFATLALFYTVGSWLFGRH